MRSRREIAAPSDVDCSGKIIIQNIQTKLYSSCAVVKFSTDLEAAGAVQCENGIRRFGSMVSIKHAEPETLRLLERSKTPVGYSGERQKSSPSRRSVSQSRRSISPRSSSPGRRSSRSGPAPVRDNHPLTWLSEAADQSGMSKTVGWSHSTSAVGEDGGNSGRPWVDPTGDSKPSQRPYDVAILAITHDLVPYAEVVQERVQSAVHHPEANGKLVIPPRPTSHIMVLVNVDHLAPCLQDLTNDGVLFAIIVNAANWTHNSCTLRILHSSTQQEHRNMPLPDAISLLSKDYVEYVAAELASAKATTPSFSPRAPSPDHRRRQRHRRESSDRRSPPNDSQTAVPPDDPTFLAPSRHISTLLRMLADSRVLSGGELDELGAFVAERRARLTNEYSTAPEDSAVSNAALKSRILEMLYPGLKSSSSLSTAPSGNPPPPASCGGVGFASPHTPSDLVSKLKNPAVQQALDSLIRATTRVPSDRNEPERQNSLNQDIRQVHRGGLKRGSNTGGSHMDPESTTPKYAKRPSFGQPQPHYQNPAHFSQVSHTKENLRKSSASLNNCGPSLLGSGRTGSGGESAPKQMASVGMPQCGSHYPDGAATGMPFVYLSMGHLTQQTPSPASQSQPKRWNPFHH
ncbi:unnamed protein product [Mesocestoides corti]|uniref:RRM domain-containing protein n=1 Tax=Mesocestoides corti TaxID=53468 RepID=A0A0R3UM80_MESCO|nr:unnamed protein product [Mesocestoides corti]